MKPSLPLTYYLYLPRFLGKLIQDTFSSVLIAGFLAFVFGKFLDQLTPLEPSRTILFLVTSIPLIIYLCIKDFRYWPRKIIIEKETIHVIPLLGKVTTINREDITVYRIENHLLTINGTNKQIKFNIKSLADNDRLILTSVFTKWVPRHALPDEIEETFSWLDTHPDVLTEYSHASATVETISREIKNQRYIGIFMFLTVAALIIGTIWVRPIISLQAILPLTLILSIAGLFAIFVWKTSRPMLLTIDEQGIFTQKGKSITEWYWEDVEVILLYWYSSTRHLTKWKEGEKQTINLMFFDQADREQIANTLFKQTLARDIPFGANIL